MYHSVRNGGIRKVSDNEVKARLSKFFDTCPGRWNLVFKQQGVIQSFFEQRSNAYQVWDLNAVGGGFERGETGGKEADLLLRPLAQILTSERDVGSLNQVPNACYY